MNFSDLPLDASLQRAIVDAGYTTPTPIQEKAIPPVLEHKDLMGIAQTGTGKTAAFALPILQNLLQEGSWNGQKPIRVLILLPTRELAIQVSDCFEMYQKYTRLTTACIFGGVSDTPQKRALSRGVDILIATPGRLLDLVGQKVVSLKKLEYFVLDEADRMLDMGFVHDIRKVVAQLPQKRQNLFFSATMPPEITKLAASILHTDPVRVEVAPQSKPIERIRQELYRIDKRRKGALLKQMLEDHPEMKKVLVFSRTKHGADKIVRVLEKAKITCAAIHGNKSQNRRQEALGNFKTEQIRVLVATDIAARGIDVDSVSHVFNYDLPDVPETFVHRIGRTARAGKEGVAISFCAPDEEQDLHAIERLTKIQIPEGDKSILNKLPPPQKETPESEARNSRWRTGKFQHGGQHSQYGENRHGQRGQNARRENRSEDKNENRGQERSEKPQPQKQHAQQRPQNAQNPQQKQQQLPKTHSGKRLGSRARKRLREEQRNQQQH